MMDSHTSSDAKNTSSTENDSLRSTMSRTQSLASSTASTLVADTKRRHDEKCSSLRSSVSSSSKNSHTNEQIRRGLGPSELGLSDAQLRILQLKRDINAAGAELPRRVTDGLFKQVCSTDLLFLIDTTSSMLGHINAAKEQVKSIVDDIGVAFVNEAEVRIAVVGYKDHSDKPSIQSLDFTTDPSEVRTFLDGLNATGGADWAEDVLGGISQALNATWKNQTRCIIHIGDAPPHGRMLHDMPESSDSYLTYGSEPHLLTYKPLMEQMIKLRINYALLRINHTTDRMAYCFFQEYAAAFAGGTLHKENKFHQEATKLPTSPTSKSFSSRSAKSGLLFEEQKLGTSYSALRHLVVKNVTSSASRTAVRMLSSSSSSSSRITKAGIEKKRDTALGAINEDDVDETQLETVPPQWNTPHWLNETLMVEGFLPEVVVHGAKTLDDMMGHDDNILMNTLELIINKRSRPFSEGALRVASYARTAASTDCFVVKSFKRNSKRFVHMAEDMRCQALCKAFALEFNALVGDQHSLDFIVTTCLKGRRSGLGSGDEFLALEPFIEGTYVKYNNNSGFVNSDDPADPFNQAAQAFSHFTFERSQGRFLVSDLQGVGRVLTDPAVHTLDPERFKLADTNLGIEGFKFFFASHICNDICRKLQLKSSNASMLRSGNYDFRQEWPSMADTVCCSNKLCGRIVRLDSAKKSDKFPCYHWCHTCWPQLQTPKSKLVCAMRDPRHEFEVSKFFYESQGMITPVHCPKHRGEDLSRPKLPEVGGNLWARLKFATRKK